MKLLIKMVGTIKAAGNRRMARTSIGGASAKGMLIHGFKSPANNKTMIPLVKTIMKNRNDAVDVIGRDSEIITYK